MKMTNDGSITIDNGPAHRGLVHVLTGCAAPGALLKPVGRRARRAAFYDHNRRKAQGRIIKQDQEDWHFWTRLADDQLQRVVHDGYLYIVLDPETMIDTGSALHRVIWSVPERTEGVHRLIPQGAVPDWIRGRLPDNTLSLEYLEK